VLVSLAVLAPTAGAAPLAVGSRSPVVLPLAVDDAGLARFARGVSEPGSPLYGRFIAIGQLARRFGASPSTRRRVLAYLRGLGARDAQIDATGSFAYANLDRALLGRLRSSLFARRGLIAGMIAPGLGRFTPGPAAASRDSSYAPVSGSPAGCGPARATGAFTPNQYLTAYGYDPFRRSGISGQGQRAALIEIDGFAGSDIAQFGRCFAFRVPPLDVVPVDVSDPLPPGPEATLDLEVLSATAPGLRSIDVYETNGNAADFLKALAAPLQRQDAEPQVVSDSLGDCESDLRASGPSAIAAYERTLQMYAATGISFVAESGDRGSSDCQPPNGQIEDQLAVDYPASSAWSTAVGGTNFHLDRANRIVDQQVWNNGSLLAAGGGGASVLFGRPGYQQRVTAASARAVPDLALLADDRPGYAIFCSASDCFGPGLSGWAAGGGTSAAAPLLAGGLALVDQYLSLNHRPSLGLVNPVLYELGASRLRVGSAPVRALALDDVTAGDNDLGPWIPGGDHRPLGCCTARRGYDEASGWGGVDVAELAGLAVATAHPVPSVVLRVPGGQRPFSRRAILVRVRCTTSCLVRAGARLAMGRGKAFALSSATYLLAPRRSQTVSLSLSGSQIGQLRTALARHASIGGTVAAEILGLSGQVERRVASVISIG
jgi:hypothetical protein